MENASNALLMTAGILIGVMIISLGTYLFMTFGSYSKSINDRLTEQQIEEFNAQFTKYQTTQNDETTYCTVYDIVTIINLARNENEKYEEYKNLSVRPRNFNVNSNTYIFITITNDSEFSNVNEMSNTQLKNFIEKRNEMYKDTNTDTVKFRHKYTCTVNISEQTKLVKSIIFTKNQDNK